jgi:adenosylcobyric acid synthase
MVLGTASNVGKSLLTLAFCRFLRNQGLRVTPFKALNIALNSWVTVDGCEMGLAQAEQALAAGCEPDPRMNPVLVKPGSSNRAQFILRGKLATDLESLPAEERRERLRSAIRESYGELSSQYDAMILEGSGSTAEVNLWRNDISNLWLARVADARCVLVADIDRGGVFASILGTLALLSAEDRSRFEGFIINKFQGSIKDLSEGVRFLEAQSGIPCLGVIPMLPNLHLRGEDILALKRFAVRSTEASVRIIVIRLPHMANFSDFEPLAAEPSVDLIYSSHPDEPIRADLLILPGTKDTFADLSWILRTGWANVISKHIDERRRVLGICGGMQMLGSVIEDPHGVEAAPGTVANGLQLLPIRTIMQRDKELKRVRGRTIGDTIPNELIRGYEIHMGRVEAEGPGYTPLFQLERDPEGTTAFEGAIGAGGMVLGTHIHSLFDEDDFRRAFLNLLRSERGLPPLLSVHPYSAQGYEREIDRWTTHVLLEMGSASLDRLFPIPSRQGT